MLVSIWLASIYADIEAHYLYSKYFQDCTSLDCNSTHNFTFCLKYTLHDIFLAGIKLQRAINFAFFLKYYKICLQIPIFWFLFYYFNLKFPDEASIFQLKMLLQKYYLSSFEEKTQPRSSFPIFIKTNRYLCSQLLLWVSFLFAHK